MMMNDNDWKTTKESQWVKRNGGDCRWKEKKWTSSLRMRERVVRIGKREKKKLDLKFFRSFIISCLWIWLLVGSLVKNSNELCGPITKTGFLCKYVSFSWFFRYLTILWYKINYKINKKGEGDISTEFFKERGIGENSLIY